MKKRQKKFYVWREWDGPEGWSVVARQPGGGMVIGQRMKFGTACDLARALNETWRCWARGVN